MPTTSNFGWTTPADTDLVKDGAAAIRTLGSGIDTSLVDLKGGTTGQVLSKASNTDLDYSWTTPTDQTPLTTKGDLFGYSTADARIPVGSDGQVLTADSAETLGVKWAAPAAGGKVLQVVEASTDTTVTISTGNGTYNDSGLSATITPSATNSKILVIVAQQGGKSNVRSASFRLVRTTTAIANAIYQWDNSANADFQAATVGFTKLDSPNTTSAVTYKTELARGGNQGSVTAQTFGASQSTSVMILIEIGA